MKLNPIILIPARMASTRLPDKPLLGIGGTPMIVQVWRRVKEGGYKVVVACDGEKIKTAIEQAGGEAVLTDPGLPSGSDRIWQALQKLDAGKTYDTVVNVQGDMPTLDSSVIGKVLVLLQNGSFDIATAAARITDEAEIKDPAVVKVTFSKDGMAQSFSRAAQGQGPHYHHIGIYAYRRAALEKFVNLPPSPSERREKLEQLRAMDAGMTIGVAVVDTVPLGVDTQETLEKARKWYGQNG